MKKLFFINCLFLMIFFSCKNNLENVNLSNALKEIPYDTIFSISDINTVSWDTMFISKPYEYAFIREKKINMPSGIDEKFENLSISREGYCVLIFIKDHTLVNYSLIPRSTIADFANIDSLHQGLPSHTQFKKIFDGICPRIVSVSLD